MSITEVISSYNANGFRAYPRDGRPGAGVVEYEGYHLEFDRFGIYEVVRVGESTPGTNGVVATTLNFLPSEVHDCAIAAAEGSSDIFSAVRAAVAVAKQEVTA